MEKINKLTLVLFLIAVVLVISGFVLHFYYGPVTLKYALIGGFLFFLGMLIFVILIVFSLVCKIKTHIKRKKI